MEVPDPGGVGPEPVHAVVQVATEVDGLADWSTWASMAEAAAGAPTLPGVYMAAMPGTGEIIYVGMAGERHGRGIRGRLAAYQSGRGVVSGFGQAAMDRALRDVDWVRGRLVELEAGTVATTKDWAAAAIVRIDPRIRWTVTQDRAGAQELERLVVAALASEDLWNRVR